MCNQNFDQQKYFHCVAQSDENWMVWNFCQKKSNEDNDIMSHVPKFLNVHHVVVKTFQGSQFLRYNLYLYERWVKYFYEFIYVMNSFMYEFFYKMNLYIQWIHVYQEFINSMNSSNRHVFRQANLCCINNQMWISLFTCPKGNQWITAGDDKYSALENLCCTLQRWFIRNRYGIEENPIGIQTLWGHVSTYIRGLII